MVLLRVCKDPIRVASLYLFFNATADRLREVEAALGPRPIYLCLPFDDEQAGIDLFSFFHQTASFLLGSQNSQVCGRRKSIGETHHL